MSTPPPVPRKPPARNPLASAVNVVAGVLGLFFVVLTLLVLQVRAGKDPSLGSSATGGTSAAGSAAAAGATRTVVTKTS